MKASGNLVALAAQPVPEELDLEAGLEAVGVVILEERYDAEDDVLVTGEAA